MAAWRAVHSALAELGHDCYHLRVFGIGYLELLVLGLLVILLFPPRELPKLARQAARAYGSVRRIADDFHRTVMLDEELRSPIDEIRGAYDEARWDIRRAGDRIKNELSSAGEEVKKAVNPNALAEIPEPPTPEEQAYLDGVETMTEEDNQPHVPRDPMSKFPAQVGDLESSPLVGQGSPGDLVSGEVDSGKADDPDEESSGDYVSPYGPRDKAKLPRKTLPAVLSPPDGRVAASDAGVPGTEVPDSPAPAVGVPMMQDDEEPTQVHSWAEPSRDTQPHSLSVAVPPSRSADSAPGTTPPKSQPASASKGSTGAAPPVDAAASSRRSTSPGLAIPPQLASRAEREEIDESALTRVTRLPKPPSLGDANQEPGQDAPSSPTK